MLRFPQACNLHGTPLRFHNHKPKTYRTNSHDLLDPFFSDPSNPSNASAAHSAQFNVIISHLHLQLKLHWRPPLQNVIELRKFSRQTPKLERVRRLRKNAVLDPTTIFSAQKTPYLFFKPSRNELERFWALKFAVEPQISSNFRTHTVWNLGVFRPTINSVGASLKQLCSRFEILARHSSCIEQIGP